MLSRRPQKSSAGEKRILQLSRILKLRPAIPPPDAHGRTHWPTGGKKREGTGGFFGGLEYVSERRMASLVGKKEQGQGKIAFREA